MKETIVEIADKRYKVQIADDEKTRKRGLMNRESLDDDKGMLFVFDKPGVHEMWMRDTLIPLDQVFLNEDQEVIKVITREPEDDTLIGIDETAYVLEINANSGIKVGDELEVVDEEDEKDPPVMKVLAPDGSTQYELWGGERIFSRKNTVVLIRQAKKAYKSKEDKDYKRLGNSVFKFLRIQDSNEPQYVSLPK